MQNKPIAKSPKRERHMHRTHPHHLDDEPHLQKPRNALVCTECGVVHHEGRWYWGAPPLAVVEDALCPACTRIRARDARGTLRLPPDFTHYRDEIVGLIRNQEKLEKEEHPLERLMDVRKTRKGLVVTTTGIHIARRITSRLERRFHRKARMRFEDGEERVIVEWPSD